MAQRFRLVEAALPLVTAAFLLIVTALFHSTAFYWPLAAGAAVAVLLARRAGFKAGELARAAVGGMKSTMIAISILILVGALIGVWKASGTVPAMVYYGLSLANPTFLVPAAFLLALAVSMMLGTSIGTLSTLGVALMGVAQGVGAPLSLVAGALVAGALFGDRSSPLSGSLNLNVTMTGTDLRKMLSGLMPTGLTAALLSLAGYVAFGLAMPGAGGGAGAEMQGAIAAHFEISPWLLLPPVIVLVLAFCRVPVRRALGAGMLVGGALAVYIGGESWLLPLKAAIFGFQPDVSDPSLKRILAGGGVLPMYNQFLLLLVAGAFNGIMEATGMMAQVLGQVVEGVRRPLALVATTMAISTAVAMVAANQALAIIVPGRMLQPAYERAGLPSTLLSRTLADSGTVLAGIIPWNLMGLLASASLGVPVRAFLPYTFLAFILPAVSLGLTALEEQRALLLSGASKAD